MTVETVPATTETDTKAAPPAAPVTDTKTAPAAETKATTETKVAETTAEAPKSLLGGVETKPADGKGEAKPDGKAESKATDAKFEFKLGELAIDAKFAKGFEEFARESGMTPEAAQKGFAAASQALIDMNRSTVQDTHDKWVGEVSKNKELAGADGKSLKKNLAGALHAAEVLGGKELVNELRNTIYGSYPPLLLALHRANALIQDDPKLVTGGVSRELSREESWKKNNAKTAEALNL